MTVLAIDPGEVHVGLAYFEHVDVVRGEPIWECTRTREVTPEDCADLVGAGVLQVAWTHLVVEEFRLYPQLAREQTGSTMPTAELIGQIKLLVRLGERNAADRFAAELAAGGGDVERRAARWQNPTQLILQPAAIQVPTASVLKKRGIKSTSVADRTGGHTKSAELHGAHYLIRTLGHSLRTRTAK